MTKGSLRLSNDNFNLHSGENTKKIYEEQIFTDVTLVSDDLSTFRAHRTVLSGASPVIRKLLLLNQEANSVLYLKGLKRHELKAMLDFIYIGEAKVEAKSIPLFLKHASELQIKDLSADVFLDQHNSESASSQSQDLKEQNNDVPANDKKFEEKESDTFFKSDASKDELNPSEASEDNPEEYNQIDFEEIKPDPGVDNEDDIIRIPLFEPDPGNVDVFWEKNAKSHSMGILYTHQMKYKWYRQNTVKDGSSIRFDCAHKRTKDLACRARATVLVTQLEPKEAGGPVPPPIFTLSRIHSPEVHNHEPSDGKHIADHIMQVMKNELMKNPSTKIGPMADRIILEETQKYQDNEPLKSRILNSFPTKLHQTLYSHRKILLGYISAPKDPFPHLKGSNIKFLSEPKQRKRNRDARKYGDYQ